MAEDHLQLNHDGTTATRKTSLWPSSKSLQSEIIRQIFEQQNWQVTRIENITGSYWKVSVESLNDRININLYISSIRDESRQPDEYKMQLGTSYPEKEEAGWVNLVLGIYVISEEGLQDEYILSGYDISRYNFATNPSIRGTRTSGLQKAKLYGMYTTDKSVLFRPEFLYYYILEKRSQQSDFKLSPKKTIVGSIAKHSDISLFLTAIRTKPFLLLAGISGTGKSRIVRKLAQATVTEELQKQYTPTFTSSDRWSLHSPANFELIQVKPNWHNSMDVVGYLSNIPTPHYVFTSFIYFIIKAWLNPKVPFFLCVDEMNLAPVEEYFAEFLSAIESRGFENGEYITDPIIPPFETFGTFKDDNGTEVKISDLMLNSLLPDFKASDTSSPKGKLAKQLREKGLSLPKNLIVIGTVNMDETTFSFSRKVLDRAMSIEMNKVDYRLFLDDATDDDIKAVVNAFENGDITDKGGHTIDLNQLLVDRHVEAKEIFDDLGGKSEGSDALFVIKYLERINTLFEGTPYKLGYRAANEAMIYLRSTQEFGFSDRESAMDQFTVMKILSRIEGDETKLKITDSEHDRKRLESCNIDEDSATKHGALTVLTALRAIIVDNLGEYIATPAMESTKDSRENTVLATQATTSKEYRASIRKIDSMISQLDRDHFVSYWS